jgi:NTP pyrophosphatase (non-canonical NTP hydrolase)
MMAVNGLAKLIEECGELQQVAGKRLAYYTTDEHPDGGPPLDERLADEIADVIAACKFVARTHLLDSVAIERRVLAKLKLFNEWQHDPNNNPHAIDAKEE